MDWTFSDHNKHNCGKIVKKIERCYGQCGLLWNILWWRNDVNTASTGDTNPRKKASHIAACLHAPICKRTRCLSSLPWWCLSKQWFINSQFHLHIIWEPLQKDADFNCCNCDWQTLQVKLDVLCALHIRSLAVGNTCFVTERSWMHSEWQTARKYYICMFDAEGNITVKLKMNYTDRELKNKEITWYVD